MRRGKSYLYLKCHVRLFYLLYLKVALSNSRCGIFPDCFFLYLKEKMRGERLSKSQTTITSLLRNKLIILLAFVKNLRTFAY
uniref:Secreted protein n=1 Tax=Parascaris univalens TaxID=6257 RepID=A0A915C043_PARUN